MAKRTKFLKRLMSGESGADIAFDDSCALLRQIGFQVRIHGDHHIFTKAGLVEIINIQPVNTKAKPYQVKQLRNLLRAYRLDE
jgi:hypothetical protein